MDRKNNISEEYKARFDDQYNQQIQIMVKKYLNDLGCGIEKFKEMSDSGELKFEMHDSESQEKPPVLIMYHKSKPIFLIQTFLKKIGKYLEYSIESKFLEEK